MPPTIHQVTELTEHQRHQLFGWGTDVFGIMPLQLQWRPNRDWRFILEVDDQLVSHVAVLVHTIHVADRPLRVGGIGGVVTIPSAQGQGYAQILLDHVEQFLDRTLQVACGLLFCREVLVPFYTRRGWQRIPNLVLINQPTGQTCSPLPVMVRCFQIGSFPVGTVCLESLPW